ncbi:MAG: M16 family metallopeptidase, partial [Ktedonobacterales bacterium]
MTTPSTPTPANGELAPNYFFHTFPNGMRMAGQRMPSLASVTFGIQFPAGSLEEPDKKLGLTHLLAEMAFQGTQHRSVRQLTEDFEAIGAPHGAEPAGEYGRYWARGVSNRLDRALELIADVVRYPAFPADEFTQMKSIQLQEIRKRDDEPMRRLPDMMRAAFYTGTRMARRPLGLRETVEGLTPDDLRQFWQEHYLPSGALFSIAGNFDWDATVARVGELFGDWVG